MRSNTLKGIALLGVSFLLVAVAIVIAVPPANRYEISIYRAYPPSFWVSVIGALLAGSLVIIASERVSTSIDSDRGWTFGLLLMLATNALLMLLPVIRGYKMFGRSDALSHLGYVQDIVNHGGIMGNIYAPLHLLILAVANATGSDPMSIAMAIPFIFSGIYFGGMFYLVVHLFDSRERILFGLPFVMLPVLRHAHLGLRPFDLSLMLLPVALYLFVKGQRNPSISIRSTFVILLVALVVYHPLTALFLIGIFSLYVVGKWTPRVIEQYPTPTSPVSLSGVLFVVWYSTFTGIILRFERIYMTVFGSPEGESPAGGYSQVLEESSPAMLDILRVATFKYGMEFVLFGLGFLFFVLVLFLFLRKEYVPTTYTVLFAGMVGLFAGGGLLFLVLDLIVQPWRSFQIAKIGSIVITGPLFYLLLDRINWNHKRRNIPLGFSAFLVTIIILLVVLSTFSLYESPLTSDKNHQVTEMEVDGTAWLIDHRDATTDQSQFGISYRRFYETEYGVSAPKPFSGGAPPDHFNYTEHEHFGQSYADDRYLVITRRGRIVYPEAYPNYPDQWRFTPQDFEQLERDKTTSRIYDNGDFTQYRVKGTKEETFS